MRVERLLLFLPVACITNCLAKCAVVWDVTLVVWQYFSVSIFRVEDFLKMDTNYVRKNGVTSCSLHGATYYNTLFCIISAVRTR
jgi:hypothetical protein